MALFRAPIGIMINLFYRGVSRTDGEGGMRYSVPAGRFISVFISLMQGIEISLIHVALSLAKTTDKKQQQA